MTGSTTWSQRTERVAVARLAFPVAAFALVALALRAVLAARSGLWGDECLFLFVTRLPSWGAMLSFLHWNESHPPLFYALMRLWLGLAGSGERAALALPVLLSAALVPCGFVLTRRVAQAPVPEIVAAALLLSPTLTEFGVQVRPYGLLQLLGLLSSFALYRAWQEGGAKAWALYAALAAALVYTHNWGWVVLVGQGGVALALLAASRRVGARALAPLALALGGVVLAYLPWVPALLYQSRHAGHAPVPLGVVAMKVLYKVGLGNVPPAVAEGLLGVLALVGLLWLARFVYRRGPTWAQAPRTVFLALFLAAPALSLAVALLLSGKSDLMKMRCLSILLPSVIVGGVSLAAARPTLRLPALFLAALLAGDALWGMARLYRTPKSNAREVAAALAAQSQASDLILIAPPWFASSFNWYFKGTNEQIGYPDHGRVEAMRYDHLLERQRSSELYQAVWERLRAAHAARRRVWFLTDADFHPAGREPSPQLPSTRNWNEAGTYRTDQFYTQLTRWYGPGDETRLPVPGAGAEVRGILFSSEGKTNQ